MSQNKSIRTKCEKKKKQKKQKYRDRKIGFVKHKHYFHPIMGSHLTRKNIHFFLLSSWVTWFLTQHPYLEDQDRSKPTCQAQASGPSILTQTRIQTTAQILNRRLSDHSKGLKDLLLRYILFKSTVVSKQIVNQ